MFLGIKRLFVLIIALFFILASNNILAADISVIVKERGSGDVVNGAYVIINKEQTVLTTDQNGIAIIPGLEITDSIKIVAPGYENFNMIYVDNDTDSDTNSNSGKSTIEVYIYPETVKGVGLEVTKARIVEKVSKISLSREELTNAPGSQGDPLKVISSLPGVVATSEASTQVYIRGSDATDNQARVNRVPVGYLYHLGGFSSTLNPALIEDLNIFLGGFPVEYSDRLGGVIDVTLRAPKTDKQHYRFDISTISTSILAEGPVGDSGKDSYFAAFRRSYIDLLFSPADFNEQLGNDDPDSDQITTVPSYFDGQFLYRHKLDQGYLDSYYFTANDIVKVEVIGSAKSDPERAGETSSSQSFQTLGTTLYKPWSPDTNFVMPLAYYNLNNEIRVGRDATGEPFKIKFEVHTLFWQPEFQWSINKNDKLSYGIEVSLNKAPVDLYISRPPSEDDVDFNLTSRKKYRLKKDLYFNSYAPYVKYRKKWSKAWTTIAGLRYSDINVRDGFNTQEFSPRATVEYQLNKRTLFTATWGKYIQNPDGAAIIDGFGNPELKITKAEHRILGLEYLFNPWYSIKTEIYEKPMSDLVVSIDENEPPNNYSNEGSGNAKGIDIFLKRRAQQRRIGWLSLSLSKSERTNERTGVTRDFSGDIPVAITAVWGQPFSGSWNRWDWSFKAKFSSGNPYTPVIGRSRAIPGDDTSIWVAQYGEKNSERTPNQFKLDIRFARTVLFKKTKLKYYFDIQNATFSKNVVGYDYGNEFEKIDDPQEELGSGFFPFFGVEIDF